MPQAVSTASTVTPITFRTRLDDKLKLVLDSMPVGVTWANLEDGTLAYANRRFSELTGYEVSDIPTIGDFFEAAFDDPADLAAAHEGVAQIFGSNNLVEMEFPSMELTIRCKDGVRRTMAFGLVVLPEAGWMVATYLDLTDRKERERLIERLAEEDSLTGLLNRRSFDTILEQRLAQRRPEETVAMVLLDLDGFKQINDSHGHEFGDQVLRLAAQRLLQVFREEDSLTRIGGDEFAAILLIKPGEDPLRGVQDRIDRVFMTPLTIDGTHAMVGVSAGIARCPQDATAAAELYRCADRAMYLEKSARKGGRTDCR
ncbi:MAG TPA: sensor domain-containing diguanylate cyclase [Devosiaceae bacterium]|jgi:diguanylate cyclase (GGDEF)-like protein|nr:sensor domain-containing diguanylate cyclase [Devosiaceae bacterium]